MVVKYKNQKIENVRAIGFDISNELGVCVNLVQEIKTPGHPELNNKIIVLEGVEMEKLKISD